MAEPLNVLEIQKRLTSKGFPTTPDGALGSKTYAALFSYMRGHDLGDEGLALGAGAAKYLPGAEITAPLRLIHFLGQTYVESMGYRALRELWGPTPAQAGYEGRRDLGNTQPGDGKRYMGRGLLQITGRGNYGDVGARIGVDLVGSPGLAEQPDIAVATACDYWRAHHLNQWADADDVLAISRAINRGSPHSDKMPNGYADRVAATARARVMILGPAA